MKRQDINQNFSIYHTRSLVVMFERNPLKKGIVYKCTVYRKPIYGDSWIRLQVLSLPRAEFTSYRDLLGRISKARNKQLKEHLKKQLQK